MPSERPKAPPSSPATPSRPSARPSAHLSALDDLFDELDGLLKSREVGIELAEKGVNISLAIVAADGLRAYVHGEKDKAAEELGTAAEEIASRLAASRAAPGSSGGSSGGAHGGLPS